MNKTTKCDTCGKVYFDVFENNICPFCKHKPINDIPEFLKDIVN